MTQHTFEKTMSEAKFRVRLKRNLRVRDIEFNDNATTMELLRAIETAPFDNRYDM